MPLRVEWELEEGELENVREAGVELREEDNGPGPLALDKEAGPLALKRLDVAT